MGNDRFVLVYTGQYKSPLLGHALICCKYCRACTGVPCHHPSPKYLNKTRFSGYLRWSRICQLSTIDCCSFGWSSRLLFVVQPFGTFDNDHIISCSSVLVSRIRSVDSSQRRHYSDFGMLFGYPFGRMVQFSTRHFERTSNTSSIPYFMANLCGVRSDSAKNGFGCCGFNRYASNSQTDSSLRYFFSYRSGSGRDEESETRHQQQT